jgi:hypothetical protein
MKAIAWRDEKLYKISARDYGGLLPRAFGVLINCVAKGGAIALVVAFFLVSSRIVSDFRGWYMFLPPLVLICGLCTGFSDRRQYVYEIEIRPDRLVRHAGGQVSSVERARVRSITEGGHWTLFGWVSGLVVEDKNNTIFIPRDFAEYPEIKSRLNSWGPIAI